MNVGIAVNVALAAVYAVLVARGIHRSKARGNIMASTFRRRHSWRWWLWTAACRPSFWISWRPRHCAGVWVFGSQVPLPLAWFPAHMRRSLQDEALVSAKAGYARGIYGLDELERRLDRILADG